MAVSLLFHLFVGSDAYSCMLASPDARLSAHLQVARNVAVRDTGDLLLELYQQGLSEVCGRLTTSVTI